MRVLVLGTGSIGMRHVGILQSMADVQVLAVPVRPERLAELRSQGIAAVPTIEEGLALNPTGVVVATDTGRHAADAATCLRSCPVLVEKPLARSTAEAEQLLVAARTFGRSLHVACCLRFDAGLAWAHERIKDIGDAHLLDIECMSWLPSWRSRRDFLSSYSARPGEGGVLLDVVHEIDSCCWFGGPLNHVIAQLENRGIVGLPAGVEETALVTSQHTSGLASSVRLSYAVRPATRRLRMWGAHGLIEWDGIGRHARRVDENGFERENFSWTGPDAMYRAQMEAWVDSLRGRTSDRLVEGAQGAYEVGVCESARRSSISQRLEKVH